MNTSYIKYPKHSKNITRRNILKKAIQYVIYFNLFVLNLGIPLTVSAKNTTNSADTIIIDTVESKSGYPIDIRVKTHEKIVKVTGKVRRKKHTSLKIRGHVDVDLIDNKGNIIGHQIAKLSATSIKIKHNRFSRFEVTLPRPPINSYAVRVTHTKEKLNHDNL